MKGKNIFSTQLRSGEIPTLMVNFDEGKEESINTLAITMVAVYLAQLQVDWEKRWGSSIEKALDFIESRAYRHETEDYVFWHFNGFYPPDWEDTSFAIYLLVKNNRLKISELGSLRKLFLSNMTKRGVGVWIKDPYSSGNANQNQWDPTSALNILRLYYLFKVDEAKCNKMEEFIIKNLSLYQFEKATLYYTPPITAFFAQRLLRDFSCNNTDFRLAVRDFYKEVRSAINDGSLLATPFEKALLKFSTKDDDQGLIFHHGRRMKIWYGSPVLHQLALLLNSKLSQN